MTKTSPCCFTDPGFISCDDETAIVQFLIRPNLPTDREQMLILAFDPWKRLVGIEECVAGDQRSALLAPAAVRRLFATLPASALLLAHNHPSGEASPSKTDIAVTRNFMDACGLVGLTLDDHVIITDRGHFSFRAAGLL